MAFPHRTVFDAARLALQAGDGGVLALVLETEGSTYVRAGAAMFFGGHGSTGWLSGGCLEPEIARHAAQAGERGELDWLELDTRDDEDLLGGSSAGCRGRLRLALLPLAALPGFQVMIERWFAEVAALLLTLDLDGQVRAQLGDAVQEWRLPRASCRWETQAQTRSWDIAVAPLPRVAVFGAGPESATLLPLLRTLGARVLSIERRSRWEAAAALADVRLATSPAAALSNPEIAGAGAALVMHHHFEFDREALEALAGSEIEFVGLLGPRRRRDDLFRLLPAAAREALEARLHSPVGLHLGGHGAEAIALSIAAQWQAWRHGI
jgi:xanthine dehydrogenase accessory factor